MTGADSTHPWRWAWLPFACAILAYGAACLGTFVYDDHHSVADNLALRSLANVPAFFADPDLFSALDNRMYRPILLCSFALNHAIAGVEPWIFKLTNLLLHAGSAALLFGLARRLGATPVGAALGATLFAVHPLASEAVNMVSGRSEVLAVFALMVGLHCHLSAMTGRRWAHAGTVLAAVVACGSKETGVILPALLVVLEGLHALAAGGTWRGWSRYRAGALRVVPVVAVVIVYLLVRKSLLGVATLDAPEWSGGGDPRTGAGRDMLTQLCTMAVALPRTLGLVLFPHEISLDPALVFRNQLFSWPVVFGGVLMLVLTVLGLRRPSSNPVRVLGTAFAWGTALPWVLIPLNVPLSEHRLYGPLLGLGLVLAAVCPAIDRRRAARCAAALAVGMFAWLSAERSLAYRDEKVLWQRALASNPESYRAAYSLGVCLMREGRLEEAVGWMEQSIALYPDYYSARKNLAELHLQLDDRGDPFVALDLAEKLVERVPRNPFYLLLASRAHAAVGVATGRDESFDLAERRALQCLDVAPAKGLVFRTAAHARRQQGRWDQALALLDRSVARGLDHISVLLDRREVLLELGRDQEAMEMLRIAASRDPFDARVMHAFAAPR